MRKREFLIIIFCLFLFAFLGIGGGQEGKRISLLIEDSAKTPYTQKNMESYKEIIKIGKPAIPFLIKAITDSPKDVHVRFVSVGALGEIGGEESVQGLLIALQDKDKNIRKFAVNFLGKCDKNNKDIIPALTKTLFDSEPEVVWNVMEAMNQLGDTSYKQDTHLLERLCSQLENSNDLDFRSNAVIALGMIGDKRACSSLVNALANGKVNFSDLEKALVDIGSHDAIPLLLNLLKNNIDQPPNIQSYAIHSYSSHILCQLADPNINEDLLSLMNSSDAEVRGFAANALGFANNTVAVKRLLKMASDSNETSRERENAVASLGRIGDPNAVDAIVIALKAKDSNLRRVAAETLGKFRSPLALAALLEALDEPNETEVKFIVLSIGSIGDRSAAEKLVQLLDKDTALNIDETVQSPLFANLATVVHRVLVAIMKEDIDTQKVSRIYTKEQLDNVRQAWRKKLGLDEQ
jgi:HEAT repeat protein